MIGEMAKQNMLFEGPDGCRTPTHNLLALRQNKFFLMGKIVALSILNGGPAPKFFPKYIQEYLLYGHIIGNKDNAAQIPQEDVKDHVLKVCFKWTCVYDG